MSAAATSIEVQLKVLTRMVAALITIGGIIGTGVWMNTDRIGEVEKSVIEQNGEIKLLLEKRLAPLESIHGLNGVQVEKGK